MSPSSLRALLLALAMVVQTIAGGIGVARAAPTELALSEHCGAASNADGAADSHQGGRHRHCESCCLCAGPPAVSLTTVASILTRPRAFCATGYVLREASAFPARLAYSQFARGPPAVLDRA